MKRSRAMLSASRRIVKLESALGLSNRTEPVEHRISFVDRDGQVSRPLVISHGQHKWIEYEGKNREEAP